MPWPVQGGVATVVVDVHPCYPPRRAHTAGRAGAGGPAGPGPKRSPAGGR